MCQRFSPCPALPGELCPDSAASLTFQPANAVLASPALRRGLRAFKRSFDLSSLLSCASALFAATEPFQPLSHQLLPHSSSRNGGYATGNNQSPPVLRRFLQVTYSLSASFSDPYETAGMEVHSSHSGTEHPTRMRVLSERSEPKDLSINRQLSPQGSQGGLGGGPCDLLRAV